MAFRGFLPWWAALALFVFVAIPLSVFFYFREQIKIPLVPKLGLIALRAIALGLILLLLTKPVYVHDSTETKSRPVYVMVDNSLSMTQKDRRTSPEDRMRIAIAKGAVNSTAGVSPGSLPENLSADSPNRAEMVRLVFQNQNLKLSEKLAEQGPLQFFLFGRSLRGVGHDWEKDYKPDESSTALLDRVNDLLKKDANERPAAIVIATDGRDNASAIPWEDIAAECAKDGVPLYIYGVGGTETGILQLREVSIPDTLFVEDSVAIPVRYRCQGIKDGEIEFTVILRDPQKKESAEGRQVLRKTVPVKEGEDLLETLTFSTSAEDKGARRELEVRIRHLDASGSPRTDSTEQDQISKAVRVADGRVKVLLIEDRPRWEYRDLVRILERDRRVAAMGAKPKENEPRSSIYLAQSDREVKNGGPPYLAQLPRSREELFNYDLIILGDFPASSITAEQQEWIRDFVIKQGGGLVMIAGRNNAPSSYLKTPIGDLLPVEFEPWKPSSDDSKRTVEFKPVPTDIGKRSPMLIMDEDPERNAKVWAKLPGWYFHYPVTKLKPAAVSLLDHPTKTMADNKPMSLLAQQYVGRGQVLFLASDDLWFWRKNEADKYYGRFWGQVVYRLGLPTTIGGRNQILQSGEAELGKPMRVYARLFRSDYTPLTKDLVVAKLRSADSENAPGETVTFLPVPGSEGEYSTTLSNDRRGNYHLTIEDTENLKDPLELDYRVSLPPDHELSPGNLNIQALTDLAERSGGKFYREEDLHHLASDIKPVRVEFQRRHEDLLWGEIEIVLLVVLLFSMEWLLRKMSNLS